MTLTRRIRYKRRPTLELSIAALLAVTALVIITIVVTNRANAPPKSSSQLPGAWMAQNLNTPVDLLDIAFADPSNGWIVGESGTILHTSDGGDTWTTQHSGTDVKLVAIDFASPDDGWAVGAFGTILRTSNGGDTWTTQGADVTLGISLAGVSFTDNQSGWAIAERGRVIFRTVDGGGAWTRENFPSDSPRSEMQFIDRNHGWAILNQGGVLRTSDGGLNWEHQPVTGVGLSGGFFINEQTG